jgi:hypothetical protein
MDEFLDQDIARSIYFAHSQGALRKKHTEWTLCRSKGAANAPAVGPERRLIDRRVGSYHILGLLGAGGMGEVY